MAAENGEATRESLTIRDAVDDGRIGPECKRCKPRQLKGTNP